MKKNYKKVFSAIATAALLFNSVSAVFAETTSLVITGNGADSENTTNVSVQSTNSVVQDNTANITNTVNASSSTGYNDANKNTGGDVKVETGDASTGVSVSNTANSNVAQVNGCCDTNASVEISGNGADTDNTANLDLGTDTQVFQTNEANIKNNVWAGSDTGYNDANKNTGGNVTIKTGDADTTVLIDNKANSNLAKVGDGSGAGSVSLRILGNGADSENTINLDLNRSLVLEQDNYASIRNNVDASSESGNNDAKENTGGNVKVETGDASTGVGIDNLANFNVADLNCGCLLDVLAKVAGNGADSENTINAKLVDDRLAFQTNDYSCGGYDLPSWGFESLSYGKKACNDVNADSSTGDNQVKESTGSVFGGDPTVKTGDASTLVETSTTANSNVLSDGTGLELPGVDFNFDFGVNWSLLWAFFHSVI